MQVVSVALQLRICQEVNTIREAVVVCEQHKPALEQ
jgi:hypothetical protein